MPALLPPFLVPVIALISVTPDPIALQVGPIPVYWYGVCYAIGLAAAYLVITAEARRRGLDARLVDNGIIIVAAAALIGGRLYHVIDQWQLYKDNLPAIVLPPYTGLGVYGGIITGTLAAFVIIKLWKQSFWKWADVIAPGLFVMQAVGRWGNFFNQELYGPPTDLPWGITIDCAHRVVQYPCAVYPAATTGFHPLFLYESVSGILGAITLLWIARRWGPRMRPGDLFLIWIIWYSVVRFALENLRSNNWTLNGIPTAMIVSTVLIVGALVVLAIRHRPGAAAGDRWGDPPERPDDADVVEEVDDEAVDEATGGAEAAPEVDPTGPEVAPTGPEVAPTGPAVDPGAAPAVDPAEPAVDPGAAPAVDPAEPAVDVDAGPGDEPTDGGGAGRADGD